MRDYPEILIMRHGETEWNRAGIMQGQMDSALTDKGRVQAAELAALLAGAGLTAEHRAWVSPLGRAQQTAAITLPDLFSDWTTDARLAEINVGPAQGMRFEDMLAAFPELSAHRGQIGWQFHVPGGETCDQFAGRIQSWLDELTAPAVVIAHGVTSRVLRALVLGLDDLNEIPGGQGIVHRIRDGRADILRPADNQRS